MATHELGTYGWEFIGAYIEAALFTSTDNSDESGGEPLDRNYTAADIAESSRQAITKDCVAFMKANRHDLESDEALGAEQAGHDFWLTRNGHGAGFWDGDWPAAMGKRLTASAKKFGNMDLYVGDDGKLYITSSKYPGGKGRKRRGGKARKATGIKRTRCRRCGAAGVRLWKGFCPLCRQERGKPIIGGKRRAASGAALVKAAKALKAAWR